MQVAAFFEVKTTCDLQDFAEAITTVDIFQKRFRIFVSFEPFQCGNGIFELLLRKEVSDSAVFNFKINADFRKLFTQTAVDCVKLHFDCGNVLRTFRQVQFLQQELHILLFLLQIGKNGIVCTATLCVLCK